ncbi:MULTISPECIES: WecB/TagA/CpsF family glycosyltransferase [Bacillales]|uniref:WecB/TagA/CpsF family glycosyltransferase n=1 Tax=Bacillales TaxID=1385 RepID=UPI00066FD64B|nr:WecB/TagA/CpsF family glycosyltransferase [Geobacillus stearothermophilus]KMY57238.1 acetyl-mannosamine transferase [Geobacillus stearothermophilus]MED3782843.1 WecB/TagA/CpsF family glycosyltransferase [Geobacillus stearothermophilus]
MKQITIFDIRIDNVTLEEACNRILAFVENGEMHKYVVTPNVDHIIKIQKDKEFRHIYKNASLVLADGMPLVWAAKLLKKPLKEKVSGSDLFPVLCEKAARRNMRIFFLGGQEGVAQKAAEVLKRKYPEINIVGIYSPPFGFEKDEVENRKIINMINDTKPDILFVGLGAPKQEKWIYHHLNEINVPVSLGIGASFDFVAGTKKRAPAWMQKAGLEWFWRFCLEPRRLFKRYFIEDAKFIYLFFRELLLRS